MPGTEGTILEEKGKKTPPAPEGGEGAVSPSAPPTPAAAPEPKAAEKPPEPPKNPRIPAPAKPAAEDWETRYKALRKDYDERNQSWKKMEERMEGLEKRLAAPPEPPPQPSVSGSGPLEL